MISLMAFSLLIQAVENETASPFSHNTVSKTSPWIVTRVISLQANSAHAL
jgi:hypothetical protein